jgi:hypothetical protein
MRYILHFVRRFGEADTGGGLFLHQVWTAGLPKKTRKKRNGKKLVSRLPPDEYGPKRR